MICDPGPGKAEIGDHAVRDGVTEVKERHRHLCLGTLRRDGFVSWDAPREGWALTAPLRCPGGKLHINAKTAGDGVIQVAIREGEGVRDGEWPEAWSLDYATDFTGDQINADG